MKKSQKVLISIIAILIGIFIIGAIMILSNFENISKLKSDLSNFSCELIDVSKSKENGYSKDIYLKFGSDPVDEKGNSKEIYYEKIIVLVNNFFKNTNVRIIDQSREIIVTLNYNDSGTVEYLINNDSNFFDNELIKYQTKDFYNTEQNLTEQDFTKSSIELNNIENSTWNRRNANLGNSSNKVGDYENYFNNGYKIKVINSEIYNIVFSKNYSNKSFKKLSLDKTKCRGYYEKYNLFEYKFDDFYVFVGNNETSIYKNIKWDDTEKEKNLEFANAFEKYNENDDYKTFITTVTSIYPDYDLYYTSDNRIKITYSNRGFSIEFGGKEDGVKLYKNFQGNITKNISIDTIIKNNELPNNCYTYFDEDLTMETEKIRIDKDNIARDVNNEDAEIATKDYVVTVVDDKGTYLFSSVDNNNIDSNLVIDELSSIIKIDEDTFLYGEKGIGISAYNANTLQKKQLVTGKDNFVISEFNNNIIYYDDGKTFKL